jgi:hypothetical protein
MIMTREISDIVRDKIIEAREGGTTINGNSVILTDEEACDIWSALSTLEAEVHMIKNQEFRALKERLQRMQNALKAVKKKMNSTNLDR